MSRRSDPLEWMLGTGYVRLWEQLHRAEEASLDDAPPARLLAEAMRDTLRLQGSNIENREQLLDQLNRATAVLGTAMGVAGSLVVQPVISAGLVPPDPAGSAIARQLVRQVRQAINEYRDERRYAIVRARNQLLRTIGLTSAVTYALLVVAILVGASETAIRSAVSLFLVGAVVGLFNRLYLDASADTAVEDYGLSNARLLHTPILCGLAALGGALLVPLLSVQINPTPSADASTAQQSILTPSLDSLFNVTARPFSLVLAAVFGLTPSALISRLQSEAEKYKSELKNSEAPQGR